MEALIARHGLVIGKFLPPHRGHLHLVQSAREQVDRLTVLVCSLASEPIDGALRHQWMRELAPDVNVVHCTDENPQYPHEHPDFWNIWIETIHRYVDEPIDVVFSSEDYGDELARRLRATHVPIDRARATFPISGTAVREAPMANWDFIPSVVRPYFARTVVLTGSECTGKTTLSELLAEHYRTVWVPEFGRTYVDQKNAPLVVDDIEAIARGQIESEERLAREANRLVVQDTDLVSTVVYGRHYFGEIPQWIIDAMHARKRDLYLLADIDVPWEADGMQRDRGDRREEMQELFRAALRELGVEWVDLRGSVAERMKTATAAIDRLLGAPAS